MGNLRDQKADKASLVKLITQEFMQNPYPDLARYQETGSAIAVENGGFRMWLVTGYDQARSLLADRETMRDLVRHRDELIDKTVVRPERKARIPRSLRVGVLDRDGEDHRRLRATITDYLRPSRIAGLKDGIERHVAQLLAGLPRDEPFDLVQRFTLPVATEVMTRLLGLPEADRDTFPLWVNAMLTGGSIEETQSGAYQLSLYTRRVIAAKRAEPADDITTDLIRAAEDGVMDEPELESMIGLLLIAGIEPASTISSAVHTLLHHPDQFELLRRQPELLESCVEESIRFESPFRMLPPRYREEPYLVGEVVVPPREFILVSCAAANRDPRRFDDPDTFDITRDTTGHMGFSHGPHRCAGAALGRMETTIALRGLLDAFPDISFGASADHILWRPGTFMRRLYSLPVVVRTKPRAIEVPPSRKPLWP